MAGMRGYARAHGWTLPPKSPPKPPSRNAIKQRHRQMVAKLKGAPGGWKKALRMLQALHRQTVARAAVERAAAEAR